MAYITRSNLVKIRKNIDTQSASVLNGSMNDLPIDKNLLTGEFRLLSDYEKMWLHCARAMYENFEVFVYKVYKKIEKEDLDSFTYINEGEAPSYHEDQNCLRLKADFKSDLLPEEIKIKGREIVDQFRKWYKDEIRYNKVISDFSFSDEAEKKFGVKVVFPLKMTLKNNSGEEQVVNKSLHQLEEEITIVVNKALSFYRHSSAYRKIIDTFGGKAHKLKEIFPDKSSEEHKILKEWLKLKENIKSKILDYFQAKFNKNLDFNEKLLIEIGFKPCKHCSTNQTI